MANVVLFAAILLATTAGTQGTHGTHAGKKKTVIPQGQAGPPSE